MNLEVGKKVFINGHSDTIELTIIKVGRKYCTFDNPKYRYVLEYQCVQIKRGNSWAGYTHAFYSAEAAEVFIQNSLKRSKPPFRKCTSKEQLEK